MQPVPEELKTRELVSPSGDKARVTGDKVETQSFLGKWQEVLAEKVVIVPPALTVCRRYVYAIGVVKVMLTDLFVS